MNTTMIQKTDKKYAFQWKHLNFSKGKFHIYLNILRYMHIVYKLL